MMLPALPDTLGNIRQVFPAVLVSLRGEANALKLQPVRHAIVILVDGLGAQNLAARTALAPTLEKHHSSQMLTSVFPSSTVANLTSLATGLTPDEHGLFGYRIFDRDRGEEFNLLSGMDKYSILDYLKQEPLSASNPFNVVTLEAYRDSGFTRATMHGASHYFADDLQDRFRIAADLTAKDGQVTYLYVPELDQTAHAFGWQKSLLAMSSLTLQGN